MQGLHQLQITQPGQRRTRKTRNPTFPIAGGIDPMGLYPSMFLPVLPGETLDEVSLKATYVSAPVKSNLAGAWYENWWFYVRITDINPALSEMFIGQLTSTAGYTAPVNRPRYFTKAGQIDWLFLATQKVMESFFLNEGETPILHPDGVYMIKRINTDAFESAVVDPVGTYSPEVTGDAEGAEISEQMAAYLRMRQLGMGFTSYDDYLRTYGLTGPEIPHANARGEPELLAYRRHWTQPTNVVDPADGSARGAWYWRIEDSNTKAKRFLEPGFVIGFHAVRPKLLDAKWDYSMAASLWGFSDWIPSYTLDDPTAGLRKVVGNAQPWFTDPAATAQEIWYDHRDLLANGEQFDNSNSGQVVPVTAGRSFAVGATQAQLRGEYVANADIDALWVTPGGTVSYDGIVQVKMKGHVQDAT